MGLFTSVISKVRNIINENSTSGKDIFTFDSSKVFTLTETNIVGTNVTTVLVNDTEVAESGNWSYSTSTNKLTFDASYSLTSGDTIEIQYSYYPNYTDTEINNYILAALYHISVNNYKTFETVDDDIEPEPTESESNLIALVASVLIKPDNKTYRLPDITINVPSTSLPTDDMVRKTIATFKRNSHGIFTIA